MSKKVKAPATIEAATDATIISTQPEGSVTNAEVTAPTLAPDSTWTLKDYFTKYPNASLRKLAAATEICYGVLLKKSKDPIVGQAYDPEATNWEALDAYLQNKKVCIHDLDWAVLNEGAARKGGTLQKDIEAFPIGAKVYLRRDNTVPYEIVYKTATHVVIMKEGTSEPQAWANNTFLLNGPVFEPRAERKVAEEA